MCAKHGQPSVALEKLLRALLLQVLYGIRSERQLMEQLDYNLLYCWFVGLNMDDEICDVTVFTKNRDRLLRAQIAQAFFEQVLEQARGYTPNSWHVKFVPRCYAHSDGVTAGPRIGFWRCRPSPPDGGRKP